MVWSLLVAFVVTPWASMRLLDHKAGAHGPVAEKEGVTTRLYRRVMTPLIHRPLWRWIFLFSVMVLLLAACAMVGVGFVRIKMLPFDNKSEFQVMIDMPENHWYIAVQED